MADEKKTENESQVILVTDYPERSSVIIQTPEGEVVIPYTEVGDLIKRLKPYKHN